MPDAFTQQFSPMRFKAEALGDDDLLLTSFSGSEALSELYEYELELLAPVDKPVDFNAVLGKPAVVALNVPEGDPRLFHGLVSRFAQGARDDQFITYRVTLVPQVWLLTKRVRSRIFQGDTVPEILAKVFEGCRVVDEIQPESPGDGGDPLTFYARDYCVQYRESDFDFAARLMEEEGIYYYFRHTAEGDELVLSNTPDKHDPIADPATVIYEELTGGNREEQEGRITGWVKSQEVRAGKVTLWDHHFELPDDRLEADQKIQNAVAVGQVNHTLELPVATGLELYDYPGGYAGRFDGVTPSGDPQKGELDKLYKDNRRTARVRIQEEASQAISVDGTSSSRLLAAGHRFTLERHFDADGDYVLTRVTHSAGFPGGGYRSGDGASGFQYSNEFQCVPFELPFRPARVTPKPTVKGTQTAKVVGPSDREIHTDLYGRIKVQFHWDREHEFNGESSCWIRVATIWAGQGWGQIHIPRIGQEVVVDFLEGDPDQPIVIGSVYNADQVPPGALPAEGMVSGLMSRSTPKGAPSNFNGFRANDTKGKEALSVQAEYDMSTLVKHDDTQTIKNNRVIDVTGTHTETVKGDTSVTVSKGNFTHDVQTGTAFVHVKGAVTEFFETTQDTTVSGNITVTSAKGTITVQEVDGNMQLYAKTQVGVQSGTQDVVVIAATEIKLITGASSLVMKSDGTITLSGVHVTVVGTADAQIGCGNQNMKCDTSKVNVGGAEIVSKATGNHTVFGAKVMIN